MAFLFAPSGERLNIRAILATDSSGVIGYDGHLIFNNPADLVFFQRITTNNICVMGRKTFESIGKVLKNRQTIILTNHPDEFQDTLKQYRTPKGTPKPLVISNFEKELPKICDKVHNHTVFICGGAQVYEEFASYCSAFIVTKYAISVEDQAMDEEARLKNVALENESREKKYECKDFNLPTDPKDTFIPYDYDPKKVIRFPTNYYMNLFCVPVETGKFQGVRYAIRTYRRGSSPQPTTITEQEKINRAKYRLEYQDATEREMRNVTKL